MCCVHVIFVRSLPFCVLTCVCLSACVLYALLLYAMLCSLFTAAVISYSFSISFLRAAAASFTLVRRTTAIHVWLEKSNALWTVDVCASHNNIHPYTRVCVCISKHFRRTPYDFPAIVRIHMQKRSVFFLLFSPFILMVR